MEFVEGETLAQILARLSAAEGKEGEKKRIFQAFSGLFLGGNEAKGGSHVERVEDASSKESALGTGALGLGYHARLALTFAGVADGRDRRPQLGPPGEHRGSGRRADDPSRHREGIKERGRPVRLDGHRRNPRALVRENASIRIKFTPEGGKWSLGELRALSYVERPLREPKGK